MKKFLVILGIIVLVLGVSGFVGYNIFLNYVGDEIINTFIDNEIKELEEQIADIDKDNDKEKNDFFGAPNNTTPASNASAAEIKTSIKKLKEVKKEVTTDDKKRAANLVMKRLTSADIAELKSMVPGGLSSQEKKRAKQIAYSRFSAAEINEIKSLYHKYMNKK